MTTTFKIAVWFLELSGKASGVRPSFLVLQKSLLIEKESISKEELKKSKRKKKVFRTVYFLIRL